MLKTEILSKIDHTELRANATDEDYRRLCAEACQYRVAAVCVPPCWVESVRKRLPEWVNVCTVVGFPLGYSTTQTKAWEAQQAIMDGANEIDMMINIGYIYGGERKDEYFFSSVRHEISRLREICRGDIILKVIVETCYLNEAQKIALCRIVSQEGADFIKTSTGFGPGGAKLEDIALFRQHLFENVKIKAAGGISTIEAAKAFINAGCDRIGSSKLVRLLAEVDGDEV